MFENGIEALFCRLTSLICLGVGVLLIAFAGVDRAAAADLTKCGGADEVLTKPDGTITLAAKCFSDDSSEPGHLDLIQVLTNGAPDTGFGEQGVAEIAELPTTEQEILTLFATADNKTVVATNSYLTRVRNDGSVDPAFGVSGKASFGEVEALGNEKVQAAGQQGDSYLAATVLPQVGVVVARFDSQGNFDESFGESGAATVPTQAASIVMTVDPQDRIMLLLTGGAQGPELVRLSESGAFDCGFGPDGTGTASIQPLETYAEVLVRPNGRIEIYGEESAFYDDHGQKLAFDETGSYLPSESGRVGTGHTGHLFVEMPSGRIAYSILPSRGEFQAAPFRFGWATGLAAAEKFIDLSSPESAQVTAMTFQAEDESLVAAGTFSGPVCAQTCSTASTLAVVKVDPSTGQLIQRFGNRGVSLIPGNRCPEGDAEPRPGIEPNTWRRCKVKAPGLSGIVRLKKAASSRPIITGRVSLKALPEEPSFMIQKATITLPGRLRVNGRKLRSGLRVRKLSKANGTLSGSIKGRRISVKLMDDPGNYDLESGGQVPRNQPLSIGFRLGSGALKRIPRKQRRTKFVAQVSGEFIPFAGLPGFSYDPSTWFEANDSSKSFRVRRGER